MTAKRILRTPVSFITRVDFWIITGLFAFTLFDRYPLLSYLKTHNYCAVSYIYSWILLWNCRCIETFDFSNYWASNAMYPYDNAFAFSETLAGLTPIGCPIWSATHDPVLTINILSLLLVWFTAVCGYLAIKKMTGGKLSALAGTIIFAFYPWLLREFTVGRPHMLSFLCLPLIFYSNWKYWQDEKWQHWFVIVALWFWTFLISLYTGIFLTVVLLLWNVIWFFKEKSIFSLSKIIKWATAVVIVWVLMSPLFYIYYRAGKDLGATRTMEQQVQLTGPVWSWFVTPEENWLWGQKLTFLPSAPLQVTQLENSMFPGFIALAIFFISFFIRKMPPWLSSLKWTGLITAILAIGPYALGLPIKIPMPFYALWHMFPPMKATRNPHRFSVFVVLIIGILAAHLLQRIPKKRIMSTVFKIALVLLICAEAWTYTVPHASLNPDAISIYQKLPKQGKPHVVVELPADVLPVQTRALFLSTYHWNTLINGVTGVWPPVQFQLVTDLLEFPSSHSIKILQALDVEYIVIHSADFNTEHQHSRLPLAQVRKELRWEATEGSVQLWRLQKGETRLLFNPQRDLSLMGPSQLIEGRVNMGIQVSPAKEKIVFNPKAPVRFAFHSSRPWYFRTQSGSKETYIESSWYAPGLFHKRNNATLVPVIVLPGVRELKIDVDVMGEKITFNKYMKVHKPETLKHPLAPYFNLPAGFKPIPWKNIYAQFDMQFPEINTIQPGDQFEATLVVTNPGPFYWYANRLNGIWVGVLIECHGEIHRFEFALPHDLFPGDSARMFIHLPVSPYFTDCKISINCFGRTTQKRYRWFSEKNAFALTQNK